MTTTTRPAFAAKMASDAQLSYIQTLLGQRNVPAEISEPIRATVANPECTSAQASLAIAVLKTQPWAPRTPAAPAAAPVTEAGMYRNSEGQVYRVKAARGSGRLYASELVITPEDGGNYSARFDYAAGAIYKLTAADRMTSEQAREIGHEFAICCVCAAELTNPVSVAAGIGPVCGGRV